MHPIGGSGVAYNYFPNGGDMVLGSDYINFWINSFSDNLLLRNVVMHEHGHGLGYQHVGPSDRTKLMEPVTHTDSEGPQEDDIRGGQRQYGDRWEANDSVNTASQLGALPEMPGILMLTEQSIEGAGLDDIYAFDMTGFLDAVDVTLTPVGSSYMQGPSGGAATMVDALSIHDLAFDLIGLNQPEVLVSVNASGTGQSESIETFGFQQGSGTYYMRVYSMSPTDDVQRYELSFSATSQAGDSSPWQIYD
jgi:hypothetical protein